MAQRIPFYRQQKDYTCGPSTLRMVLAAKGRKYTEEYIARHAETRAKTGTSNFGMQRFLRKIGVAYTAAYRTRYSELRRATRRGPVIVDWMPQHIFPAHPEFIACKEYDPEKDSHYAIVIAAADTFVTLQDPVLGRRVRLLRSKFMRAWRDPTSASAHWMLVVH